MKKKDVYISIELKVREFLSQILLSYFLSLKGYRVYLGSKNQIIDMVINKKNKSGIFFYKAGVNKKLIDQIDKNTDAHIVLDQEIGPGLLENQYNLEVPNAFHKKTLKKIDYYFALNKKIYDISKKKLMGIRGKVFLTGWPRVDLWKPKYKFFYEEKIIEIKKKYKNFILFNSDFATISKYYKEEITQYTPWGFEHNENKKKRYKDDRINFAKNSYLEFLEFVKFIKQFANNNKKQCIVIRPHPAENLNIWIENFRDIKNIHIESPKDDVTSWIYSANFVIHRGCTTALQSIFMKKPTAFIQLGKKFKKEKPFKEKKIIYELSDKVHNINELQNWVNKNKKIKNQSNKLRSELGVFREDAVDKFVKIFDTININKTEIIKKSKVKKNIFSSIFSHYKNIFLNKLLKILNIFGYNKKSASNYNREMKIFGGINKKEVNYYISKLNKKNSASITSYQYSKDIVIIEKF